MNRPQIIGQAETADHFGAGMDVLGDLFARTLGPSAGSVVGETERAARYEIYSDSGTLARRILSLGSPRLDLGAMAMRSVVTQMGQEIGDGGATAAVLMHAVYRAAARRAAAGINAMLITRQLQDAVDATVEQMTHFAQPAFTEDDLAMLARSVVRDPDLAVMLGELRYLLGADGHVNIRKFVAPYLRRAYLSGARFKGKIASAYLYQDSAQKSAALDTPLIALLEKPVTEAAQMVALMEAALAREAKSLLLLGEVSGVALNVLIANHRLEADKKKLDLLAVKLGSIGEAQRADLTDLALITGATLLNGPQSRAADNARPDDLGVARRAAYEDGAFAITAAPDRQAAVRTEAEALQHRLDGLRSTHEDRPALVGRLARLTGGVGELKIGAHTKPERDRLMHLAERALKVLAGAQRTGLVAGGGAAYHHAAVALRAARADHNGELNHGFDILTEALSAPLRQILRNAGEEAPELRLVQIAEAGPEATFDVEDARICNAFEHGIVDSAEVAVEALRAGVSGAAMVISTGAIVYHRTPQR
jgi:chaperonin GroEL